MSTSDSQTATASSPSSVTTQGPRKWLQPLATSFWWASELIMARNARRIVRAPRIMAEAYRVILDCLVDRGWDPPRRPIQLPRARLLWIIMRHALA